MIKKFSTIFVTFLLGMCSPTSASEQNEKIPERAFENCTSLSSFEIPDYVRYIEKYAFYNSGIKNIMFESNIVSVGEYAFSECTSLEKAYFYGKDIYISENVFDGDKNILILCFENSTAHKYAVENDIPYKLFEDGELLYGDVDLDGIVSARDAALVLRRAMSGITTPAESRFGSTDILDVDADGIISARDAALILRKASGVPFDFPIRS